MSRLSRISWRVSTVNTATWFDDTQSGGEIQHRSPVMKAKLDTLRLVDIQIVQAKHLEYLKQIFVHMISVVLVGRGHIQIKRLIQ